MIVLLEVSLPQNANKRDEFGSLTKETRSSAFD